MCTIQPMENINIGKACRACFEICEHYKMLYETTETNGQRSLGEVFFEVVKIETKSDTESSPTRICIPCSEELLNAYRFIQKSQHNHERLIDYFRSSSVIQPDCLSEFPIDMPKEQSISDYLHIKVENEFVDEVAAPSPIDDNIPPPSSDESDGSDYEDEEPPLHKAKKRNKMQCTYCDRVFKRTDFLENHKRKHEQEFNKKDEDTSTFVCDECGISCDSKLELKTHRLTKHPDRRHFNNINLKQKNLLAEFMSEHPSLAKNILPNSAQGKSTINRLWDELTKKLNSVGPPMKSRKLWRKVFSDQKYQVRKKLSFNKAAKKKTGGDWCKQKYLSQAEEQIIEASGLEEAVDGFLKANVPASEEEIYNQVPLTLETSQMSEDNNSCSSNDSFQPPTISEKSESKLKSSKIDDSPIRDCKTKLLQENLKVGSDFQKELMSKLDRLISIQERILELKEEKHKAIMALNKVELQMKTLQLNSLMSSI